MRTVFLGEYIKARRLELGLTQSQVCEGICEPITLSRMENGKQTPSRNRINAILQRLGLPDDRYFALLSKNEAEIEDLQKEIVSCNVHGKQAEGLHRIAELESILEPDDYVTQQFILRSRTILGKQVGSSIQPYSYEEKLALLMDAIRLTVPRFDLEEIGRNLYSLDEVKVINQIANVYSNNGQNKRAIEIYHQLLKYIQKRFSNILQSNGILPLVACCYARSLDAEKRYEDALEIAKLGISACVQYGHYSTLCRSLAIMAECHHFLGQNLESEKLYYQAYYTALSVEDMKTAEVVRQEMHTYLGICPKF